jgi:uncharacterized membrane protein YecN with MAPEG domain
MGNNVATSKQANEMTQLFAISTFILLVKYIVTVFYAANTDDHPPEDAVLGQLPKPPEDLKRRQRAFANDMENIPFHMVVIWAAYLLQVLSISQTGSQAAVLALDVLVVFYVTGRVGHTLCYAYSLQPWRTIFFTLSLASIISIGVHLIYNSFKVNL